MEILQCHTNMLDVNKLSSPVFMWAAGSCSEGSVVTCDECLQLGANCAWCTEEVISNKCTKPQHLHKKKRINCTVLLEPANHPMCCFCFSEFHRLVFSLTKV